MAVTGQKSKVASKFIQSGLEPTVTGNWGKRINPLPPYEEQHHNGTDYRVASGTLYVAGVEGVVIAARDMGGYGGTVLIYNAKANVTVGLSHMKKFDVVANSLVGPKTSIGLSGGAEGDPMQGNSTGPHLHLMVFRGKYSSVPSKTSNPGMNPETFDWSTTGPGGGGGDDTSTKSEMVIITKDTKIKEDMKVGNKYEVISSKGDEIVLREIVEGFKVGTRVKIKTSAKSYVTGKTIPNWVKNGVYVVREGDKNKSLLGKSLTEKGINSWLFNKDLEIVK